MTNMNYTLYVSENELTTSILVKELSIQITTADKSDHAMVYVWKDVETKQSEHRCVNHEEARATAWRIAIEIGRTNKAR